MSQQNSETQGEFRRLVHLPSLESGPQTLTFTATAEECEALAERYGISRVMGLSAVAELDPSPEGGVEAELSLDADVEQQSVVSLKPVQSHIAERWHVSYLPKSQIKEPEKAGEEMEIEAEEADIEPIEGESIDIGETIAQQLSLALDPYPRLEGESLEDYWRSSDEEERPADRNPFEILRKLKQDT